MAKRYGRNQRRKHREELAQADSRASELAGRINHMTRLYDQREKHLRDEFARKIEAARRARDTIKITIDHLMDERDMSITYRAMYEVMGQPMMGPIDTAYKINPRRDMLTKSQDEREAFCYSVGQEMANYALQQMMRHWRSR